MKNKKTTLIVADDHPLLLNGTKDFLKKRFFQVIDTVSDGNAAYNIILKYNPDIAILDFDMPKMNGLEVAKKCISKQLDIKIIILTFFKQEEIIKQVGKTIHGYILKDDALNELESCIKEVCKGNHFISNNLKEEIFLHSPLDSCKNLTITEIKIVRYLTKDLSSSQIAEELFISKRTVDKHRSNIIKKLNLKSSQNALLLWVQKNAHLLLPLP